LTPWKDASEDDPVSRKRKKLFGGDKSGADSPAETVSGGSASPMASSPVVPEASLNESPAEPVAPVTAGAGSEDSASTKPTAGAPAAGADSPASDSPASDSPANPASGDGAGAAMEDDTPADGGTPAAPVEEEAGDVPDVPATPAGERRQIGAGRPLPRVIAVANQKGGVGKTTTSVNLAASLAELGHRTLVVDLDPQGNAGTGLGIDIRQLDASIYDVLLHETPLDDCIEGSSVRNLFVAPSSLDLAGAEIELVPAFSREHRLRQALEQVRDDFDYVIIDCPPSLGLLTVNAFAAASEVLVPIQCEYYALEGLGQLMRNVDLVQRNLNPKLEISAVVLVMFDSRTNLALQVAEEVRAHFGDRVCQTVIPRTVRLSEAPSFGQPITTFDPTSRGATAYRELAKEVSDGTPNRAG
jgi:chromosome partitioning protein